jgi:hypothetical protein
VRDSYPERKGSLPAPAPLRAPARPAPLPTPAPSTPPSTPPKGSGAAFVDPGNLLTLEPGFDVDAFAQQLGESAIRVRVPRENLLEVLTRISEFMGFGIYVYEISVRPVPQETLKTFEVDLRRVEYAPGEHRWRPFEERGRSDTPFGPGGGPAP